MIRTDRLCHTRASQSGFTLIEMAISMMILGFLLSGILHVYTSYKNDKAVREEFQTRERITSALAFYAEQNNRLPCPADPTLTPDNNDFGKEMTTGCPAGSGVVQGMVPVHALNLPYHLAADFFDRKMTYAVTASLTQTDGFTDATAVRIVNKNGEERTVPFVLVNHGPDGKGARSLLSGAIGTACTGGAADIENCDGDAVFTDLDYATMNDVNSANHFDDRLVYSLYPRETSVWVAAPTASGLEIANKNNANVGIGEAQPKAKLHVNGTVAVDSLDDTVQVKASGQVFAGKTSATAGGEIKSEDRVEAGTEMEGQKIRASVFFYE